MKTRRAFTLVELLVVIAIISILAALLLPALAKAREMSQTAACSSIEKQWGLSFINFRNDYDDYMPAKRFVFTKKDYWQIPFPNDVTTASYDSSDYKWSDGMSPKHFNGTCTCPNIHFTQFGPYFVTGLQKAMCPSHPSRDKFLSTIGGGGWGKICSTYLWSDLYTSCWTYNTGSGLGKGAVGRRAVRASGVSHHDRKFALLEVEKYDYWNTPPVGTDNYQTYVFYYNTAGTMTYLGYHHNGYNGFNALFFDGHVSFYKFRASPTSRTDGELVEENFHD